MALIDSDLLDDDEIETEDVTVEALGGDVRVRGLDLVERLVFERKLKERSKSGDINEDPEAVALVPELLATCILDSKNRPVKSAARWRKWGSKNHIICIKLANTVFRLSGMSGEDSEKN